MNDKNKTINKVFGIISIVLVCLCFIGVLYHFTRGIQLSLFENDIKTAQNRISSSYQFLMMLAAGLSLIGSFVFFFKMKNAVLSSNIQKKLGIEE